MRHELDRLREELELVQARNLKHSTSTNTRKDGIREEIESLRDEIKMSHAAAAGSYSPHAAAYSSSPSPRTVRRSTFQQNSVLLPPRYSNNTASGGRGGEGGYGGDGNCYYDDEEEESMAPLSQRQSQYRQGSGGAPTASSLNSRHYF